MDIKTVTFDLFDTLITRKTATPKGIFAIVANTIANDLQYDELPQFVKNNFFVIRGSVEEYLHSSISHSTRQEITLEQIYQCIAHNYDITPELMDKLMQLEINTEIANLVPINENIARLHKYVEQNYKVLIISDIYIRAAIIKDMLQHIAPSLVNIPLYTSCDVGLSKSCVDLYRFISQKEQIAYNKWLHIGDNWHSDIQNARKLGIQAELYNRSNLEECEKYALKSKKDDLFLQLAIGTAKNIRINYNCNQDGYFDLGATIGGPLLFIYVDWVLKLAIKQELQTLYFIARDGYILKKIADIIISSRGYNINTKYIFFSRISVQKPYLYLYSNLEECRFLYEKYKFKTLYDYMVFFNAEKEDFLTFWPEKKAKLSNKVNNTRLNLLKSLLSNKDFKYYLKSRTKSIYDSLVEYLTQEIDFNEKYAFVEMRGTGNTQKYLNEIIKSMNKQEPFTFFYSISPHKSTSYSNYFCMLPCSEQVDHDILEALTRAPHGQTLGYQKDLEMRSIIPTLEEKEGYDLGKIKGYFEAVCTFTYQYLEILDNSISLQVKLNVMYMKFLLTVPDKKYADIIGSIPFVIDVNVKSHINEYTPKLTWLDVFGKQKARYTWDAGFKKRNSSFIQYIYCKKIYKRLLHLHISFTRKKFYLYVLLIRINLSFIFNFARNMNTRSMNNI